jgi:FixJ family two-component response regulator
VDVLLTDIKLSGSGSGWDVAEALRAAQPRIGVVYVSGKSVDQFRRVNGSLFFYKPYCVTDVLQACRDVAET